MYQRMTLAFLLLTAVSCKKVHRIDPVSIVGIGGCGKSGFMHPILVRLSGADGKSEVLIPRQQNTRAGIRGDKETSWDVEVFHCLNKYERTSEWKCEIPETPYHESRFTYDPKSPTELSVVPPKEGMRCRDDESANDEK